MKLRIRGSSVRLRLTRGEVQRVAEGGRVEDAVAFGPTQCLSYALVAADVSVPSATFDQAAIVVSIPHEQLHAWATSDDVGIEAQQSIGNGQALSILVEKDFACLTPRKGEDDGDAFPNPNETC